MIRNILKGALYFGAIAPPIGSIAFTTGMALTFIVSGNFAEIIYLLPAAVSFALFSYVFGGVPALFTGAIAGWFRDSQKLKRRYITLGGLAGVLSFCFGAAIHLRAFNWDEIQALLLLFFVPGIFGGTVTAALFWSRNQNDAHR